MRAREFERIEQLRRSGFAADAETYEQRRTARDEAAREVERLKATLSRYAGDIDVQPDVFVASRNLASARAEQERAAADVEKAYVRAPRAATVVTIHIQPGGERHSRHHECRQYRANEGRGWFYQTQIGQVIHRSTVEIAARHFQVASWQDQPDRPRSNGNP